MAGGCVFRFTLGRVSYYLAVERAMMKPVTFESRDVGRVEAFVSQLYSKMRIGAVGECTRAQIRRRVLGPGIGFDDLGYSFDIGYSAAPQDLLIICDVISSTIRRDGEGTEDTFGPGDQFLISQPDLPYAGVAHAARLRFTVLDPAILSRVAGDAGGAAGPVRMLDHRPVSREAALQLQRCAGYVRDDVLGAPGAPQVPALVVSAASQYLAACVLQAFPNNAVTGATGQDRRDANGGTVRRAVAFIDANAGLDLSLADIARAACVTPRALQLAFRRHLDTTPMAYLRRVRLSHAHHDLAAADPAQATVTEIAGRWGFATPSRFTALYRRAYGTLPSRTLYR
jgi:AraC-like DNA-binding protein